MLRIGIFVPQSFDFYNILDEEIGFVKSNLFINQALYLQKLGHNVQVHLLTSNSAKVINYNNINIFFHKCIQPPKKYGAKIRFARQFSIGMISAVKKDKLDIVHFHGIRNLHLMLCAIGIKCEKEKIPLVAQDQGYRSVGLIEATLQKIGISKIKYAISSGLVSKRQIRALGVKENIIRTIANGYDPKIFYPKSRSISINTEIMNILMVSRLSEEKDPITAILGIREYAKKNSNIKLTIIGTGPIEKEIFKLLETCHFSYEILKYVPYEQIGDHYRNSDLFVLTSLYEGWNQSITEAMACGVPVISTDVPSSNEIVGQAGLLIPARNPTAVSNAIDALWLNREIRDKYIERGLEKVNKYSWQEIAKELENIYESLLLNE